MGTKYFFKPGDEVAIRKLYRTKSGIKKMACRLTGVIDHGSHGYWYVKLHPNKMTSGKGLHAYRSSRLLQLEYEKVRNIDSDFDRKTWWAYAVRYPEINPIQAKGDEKPRYYMHAEVFETREEAVEQCRHLPTCREPVILKVQRILTVEEELQCRD